MDSKEIIQLINLHKKQVNINASLKHKTQRFTEQLFCAFFDSDTNTENTLYDLEKLFIEIRNIACPNLVGKPCKAWPDFLKKVPNLFISLKKDANAILEHDPAAKSINEIYLAYPGFYAITIYRIAKVFYDLGLPIIPRLMTEFAHSTTGIDIHPGATIGNSFFIDHGTGIVIGETTIIKDHVKIYQGVTLGALSVKKEFSNTKRHPTIENNVTIYANATILGGNTVIGENSIIGGNTWITSSIEKNSIANHNPEVTIFNKSNGKKSN